MNGTARPSSADDDFRLLSLTAAANRIGISVRTLQRWIAKGHISVNRNFGSPRISTAELRRHIAPEHS